MFRVTRLKASVSRAVVRLNGVADRDQGAVGRLVGEVRGQSQRVPALGHMPEGIVGLLSSPPIKVLDPRGVPSGSWLIKVVLAQDRSEATRLTLVALGSQSRRRRSPRSQWRCPGRRRCAVTRPRGRSGSKGLRLES